MSFPDNTYLAPEDLQMLFRVLNRTVPTNCSERVRQQRAAALLQWFQTGVVAEDELEDRMRSISGGDRPHDLVIPGGDHGRGLFA